ncbi:DNA dC-_dU-editing enzyme APOBEC-3C-like [Heptranchias perlo]|uniref:DNA dC->dU-editing enzyme APOBEC-3C-like n=1 Tax=Heptranchias perlo TaxID=212740 RepID=UPI003559780C
MPLILRRQLPKEQFYEGFENISRPHFTLLCFLLKENNKTLFDLWGYAINDRQKSHAEELVINKMEKYLVENISPTAEKYKVTFYLSYSPCANCCFHIIEFHKKFKDKIHMNIKMSRDYYLNDLNVQRCLRDLLKTDISIKVMDRNDFAKCHYLFVEDGNTAVFEPWPGLETSYDFFSKQLEILLDLLVQSEETEADGEERNIDNSVRLCCNTEAYQSAHHSGDCNLHRAPYLTPKKNVRGEEETTSQFHTPRKVGPSDERRGVGVRRTLFK